jgi:hypothetical protein
MKVAKFLLSILPIIFICFFVKAQDTLGLQQRTTYSSMRSDGRLIEVGNVFLYISEDASAYFDVVSSRWVNLSNLSNNLGANKYFVFKDSLYVIESPNKIYIVDSNLNIVKSKGTCPMEISNANDFLALTIHNKLYFLYSTSSGVRINEYDPLLNVWTLRLQFSDKYFESTSRFFAFVYNNDIIIPDLKCLNSSLRYTCSYDPITNTLDCIDSTQILSEVNAKDIFILQDDIFIGNGMENKNGSVIQKKNFYRYSLKHKNWLAVSDFPENNLGRNVCFSKDSFGYCGLGTINMFYKYDNYRNKWERINSAFLPKDIGPKYFSDSTIDYVWARYNAKENNWKPLPVLWDPSYPLYPVINPLGVQHGGENYIIGGWSKYFNRDIQEIYKYSDSNQKFIKVSNLLAPLINNKNFAISFGDKIYYGFSVSNNKKQFFEYSSTSNTTKFLKEYPGLSDKVSNVILFDSVLVLIGGYSDRYYNEIYTYNPTFDDWSIKQSVPVTINEVVGSFKVGKEILVFTTDSIQNVWSYNPNSQVWKKIHLSKNVRAIWGGQNKTGSFLFTSTKKNAINKFRGGFDYDYELFSIFNDSTVNDTIILNRRIDFDNDNLTIYPNPAFTTVNIESRLPVSSVSILDANGHFVYEQSNTIFNSSIDVSKYKSGIYTIELNFLNGQRTQKKISICH